jgi:aspartate kinase
MNSAADARPPRVMKFGGTSVEDAEAFARVARIVADAEADGALPVVVTSAMSRGTDALVGAVRAAAAGDPRGEGVEALLERHRAVAEALLEAEARPGFAEALEETRARVATLLRVVAEHPGTRRPLHDEVVSQGERLASLLLAGVLRGAGVDAVWVDARACVRTDEEYTRAAPLKAETGECTRASLRPLLAAGRVPVLGGFIGSTLQGAATTLGRGGSDYTAALVGAALPAAEVQIWTDVSGFLTADPRVVPGARPIAHLSYAEAAELAYFGAKVLHPRTIQPAVEAAIPVRVCNSRAPGSAGTLIDARAEVSPQGIKAIAHKMGVTVVQVSSARMLGAYGFLRAIFEVFDRHRTAVDIVATSEVSVSLTVEEVEGLEGIVRDLEGLGDVRVEPGFAIVCVVGEGLRGTSGIAARVFGTLADTNVTLISQGASALNLTFVVREEAAAEAVRRLHGAFFG